MVKRKYECPCCGLLTLEKKPHDTFEICPVCFWEDDNVQFDDPDYEGGANELSLNQSKANFRRFGAVDKESLKYVRKPLDSERNPKRTIL
jgi:hypothetical protein